MNFKDIRIIIALNEIQIYFSGIRCEVPDLYLYLVS